MPHLFDPLTLRGVTLRNRIGVSPMCEYSSREGFANDWHLVHLGSRAVGGAGLVMTEATAVSPEGRISPDDLGIWQDAHVDMLARICAFGHAQGAAMGVQLAHAGRKASTLAPFKGTGGVADADGGWEPVAASPIAFNDDYRKPREITDVAPIVQAFADAAQRADVAGFDVIEVHAAHGYLLHEFLSPLTNHRTDAHGGSFDARVRLLLQTVAAVRVVWPESKPVFVRISATDWVDGGWTIEDSVALARRLKEHGVDLVDCSTGGLVPHLKIPVGASYQVRFAERVRGESGLPVAAVGMITDAMQADDIIRNERADLVLLAREMLRDPYWPRRAAQLLRHQDKLATPKQYARAW